ncbi:E3 ubiquitin ligase TRIM40 [Drosophila grimshawi]|uniref:E3 ubiquitin ligase TRIM40 n=1 Tax=Drosophila grimshawi TaxID=7222 RepID=UPI0013EF5A94|nr:E3 ubiquitin ligase TRIM40 [Drosophila grimshawi]
MDDKADHCTICLCPKHRVVSIACNHTFCKKCLRNVYNVCSTKACPLCRAPFVYYVRNRSSGTKIVFFT